MARPVRIEFPDAIYHVTTRGEAGGHVFQSDQDRQLFLAVLDEVVRRSGWKIHAYVLMNNHYHLVVETPEPNLSRGMRQLNGVYTQRFNIRHHKAGKVFQGRFRAILVERGALVLDLCRHVVLNPWRLKAERQPGRYRWSSYAATAGAGTVPAWLSIGWILAQFGKSRDAAQRKYSQFVLAGMGLPSPLGQVRSQVLLGSTAFINRMKQRLELRQAVRPSLKKPQRPALAGLFTRKVRQDKALRNAVIVRAYREYTCTMAEIAAAAGLHFSTVSKVIKQGELPA